MIGIDFEMPCLQSFDGRQLYTTLSRCDGFLASAPTLITLASLTTVPTLLPTILRLLMMEYHNGAGEYVPMIKCDGWMDGWMGGDGYTGAPCPSQDPRRLYQLSRPPAANLMPMQFSPTAMLMGGRQRRQLKQLSGPADWKYSRVQAGVLRLTVVLGIVQVDELRF